MATSRHSRNCYGGGGASAITWLTLTGNVPVGDYDPTRIPNIGLGHGAIDIGGAYTYSDSAAGNEITGVDRLTANFRDPDTQNRSGIDFHFDQGRVALPYQAAFSSALPDIPYQQITDDSGQNPILGGFRLTRFRRRSANRVQLPGRRHAGLP